MAIAIACGGSPLLTGIHTLQAIKYSDETKAGTPIYATPTDGTTSGNQFRITGSEWHFNLDTKATGVSAGVWLLRATLSEGKPAQCLDPNQVGARRRPQFHKCQE